MQVSKLLHRGILLVSGLLIALLITRPPWQWAGSWAQQASLPLLLGILPLLRHTLYDQFYGLSSLWAGIFRWALLLPLLLIGWTSSSWVSICKYLAVALVFAYLLSRIIPLSWRSGILAGVGELWTESPFTNRSGCSPGLSVVMVLGGVLRFLGIGLAPALTGYILIRNKDRQLWLVGCGALLAWLLRSLDVGAGFPYTGTWLVRFSLGMLVLAPLACIARNAWAKWDSRNQLVLDFIELRNYIDVERTTVVYLSLLFIVLFLLWGEAHAVRFILAAFLSFFYALVAESTIGLVLFPIWGAFLFGGSRSSFWPELGMGVLAGVIGAALLAWKWSESRNQLGVKMSLSQVAVAGVLAMAIIGFALEPVSTGLFEFPSAVGDWLAQLVGMRPSPAVLTIFALWMSLGILRQRLSYIYLAWGFLLPVSWGLSILLGAGCSLLLRRKVSLSEMAGKSLISGDLMASLTLLFFN